MQPTAGTLRALHLSKAYKQRTVLNDVSLHVQRGEVVGLLGPNGAGKSTLFYSLVGLIQPETGTLFMEGHDLTQASLAERAEHGMAYLPQDTSIFRRLSIEDNILAILELRRDLNAQERFERLEDLLQAFNLQNVRQQWGERVSGGQRRRAEIARMLALDPHFVLLDEPFAGVDPLSIASLKFLFRNHLAKHNMGVLITDHNVKETLALCDRAYLLYDGHILAEGTPDQLLDHPDAKRLYFGEHFEWTPGTPI